MNHLAAVRHRRRFSPRFCLLYLALPTFFAGVIGFIWRTNVRTRRRYASFVCRICSPRPWSRRAHPLTIFYPSGSQTDSHARRTCSRTWPCTWRIITEYPTGNKRISKGGKVRVCGLSLSGQVLARTSACISAATHINCYMALSLSSSRSSGGTSRDETKRKKKP